MIGTNHIQSSISPRTNEVTRPHIRLNSLMMSELDDRTKEIAHLKGENSDLKERLRCSEDALNRM